uniref:Uncharacterized protein n=1 Tax=Biomphalaria glabrata TaxID=6526 RepID=A0A2C9LVI0_BIOGL
MTMAYSTQYRQKPRTQPVEKLLPPSRNKHVLHDRVAILPPSSKRVETSAVTLAEEEDFTLAEHRIDSKEDVEKKEDISKIPAGAVKHGLSGQLMQEMKDKRLSKLLSQTGHENVTSDDLQQQVTDTNLSQVINSFPQVTNNN